MVTREFWRGQPVFVTGHTGFKGGWLTTWLTDLGARVSGYALSPHTQPSYFLRCGLPDRVATHIADIRDAAALQAALAAARPRIVFHLAAQPIVRLSYRAPLETIAVNVMGTANLLEAVRHTPSVEAVVVITSDKCYENREREEGYREDEALGGHDPYSASKAAAELVADAYRRSFFATTGPGIATVRAGNVIGGGDWAEDRLVPDAMRALVRGEPIRVRNPAAVRPWQHVLEPLRGYLRAGRAALPGGPRVVGGLELRSARRGHGAGGNAGRVDRRGVGGRALGGQARGRRPARGHAASPRLDQGADAPGLGAGPGAEGHRRADRRVVPRRRGRRRPLDVRPERGTDPGLREAMAPHAGAVSGPTCLGCAAGSPETFLDLGTQPLANAFLRPEDDGRREPRFPLAVAYCARCHLVQLTTLAPPETMFEEYLYFTSYSDHFMAHAERMASTLTERFGLGPERRVLEVASNDGYLLKFFRARGIAVLGVEPARNIAAVAQGRGIPTLNRFFGSDVVAEIVSDFGRADVLVGNNVLAHVPAINDFLGAVGACLAPGGAAVFEFPYLGEMLDRTAFDTVYHEHVFYYSLAAIAGLAERAGLEVFDVESQPVHGGSLRLFLQHRGARPIAPAVARLHADERAAGLTDRARYAGFQAQVATLAGRARGATAGAAPGGPAVGRLRRARQGHGLAERLRHRHRSARVHRGSQPAQARSPGAGRAAAGAAPRGSRCARCPTSRCCCRGISRTRFSPSRRSTSARGARSSSLARRLGWSAPAASPKACQPATSAASRC